TPADLAAGALLRTDRDIILVTKDDCPASLGAPGYFSDLAFHGTTAAALSYDGAVSRRDLTVEGKWQECWPARRRSNEEERYYSIAFAPKGDRVALGRRKGVVDLLDWPAGTGPTLRPEITAARRDSYRVHALAFSPEGKYFATAIGMSGFVEDPSE